VYGNTENSGQNKATCKLLNHLIEGWLRS